MVNEAEPDPQQCPLIYSTKVILKDHISRKLLAWEVDCAVATFFLVGGMNFVRIQNNKNLNESVAAFRLPPYLYADTRGKL